MNRKSFTAHLLATALLLSPVSAVSAQKVCPITGPGQPPTGSHLKNPNVPTIVTLDRNTYPQAVCNDGTMAAYQFVASSDAYGAKNLLIDLDGGGQCYNAISCTQRAGVKDAKGYYSTDVTTGELAVSSMTTSNMLSPVPTVNPLYWDASKVLVHYCSSDYFTGTRAATNTPFNPADTTTWNFNGKNILKSVIADLLAKNSGGINTTVTNIMIAGSSAGGVGVALAGNDMLPSLTPVYKTALIEFTIDAGYAIDFPAYDPSNAPTYESKVTYIGPTGATGENLFENVMDLGRNLWGGRGDRLCDAAATPGTQRRQCNYTAMVLNNNWITVPVNIIQSTTDNAQLTDQGWDFVGTDPATPSGKYLQEFAQFMQTSMESASAKYNVFAPQGASIHTILDNSLFNTGMPMVAGSQYPSVELTAFYADPCNMGAGGLRAQSYGNAYWVLQ